MKKLLKASLIATAIATMSSAGYAAGLGQLTVQSALGQPLKAEIQLTASRSELSSLTAKVASPETFRQANVPYSPVVPTLRVRIDKSGKGNVLRITSARPVNEPFVSVLLELNWENGQLLREYSLLLDPIEFTPAPASNIQVVSPPTTQSRRPPPPVRETQVGEPQPQSQPQPIMPSGRVRELPPDAPSIASPPPVGTAAPVAVRPTPTPAPSDEFDLGGSEYMVNRGDTLRKIAEATKPEGVTLDQMLVALYRENRKAFIGNNMNRMRSGVVLTVPTADKVRASSQAQAHREVVAQAKDFNAFRRGLASSAPMSSSQAVSSGQSSSGQVTARVEEPPAPSGGDKVVVSRVDSGTTANAGSNSRTSALEEDLRARDRALEEANARLEILEQNIKDLQQLADLRKEEAERKTQELEDLKRQLEQTKTQQPAAVAEPAPAPAPATTPGPTVQTKAPVQPRKAEPGMMSNPLVWVGLVGLLVLVLGGIAYFLRQRKAATEAGEGLLSDFPPESSAGGQSVDTGATSVLHTDFTQASLAAIEADEGVDPIAEANAYIEFGRDAQAEEILRDAVQSDPDRLALYTKLLEIYARRKNLKQFEQTASELYARTNGAGPEWEAAAQLGRDLDSNNELYHRSGVAAPPVEEIGQDLPEEDAAPEATGPSLSNLDFTASSPSGGFGAGGSPSQLKDTWAVPRDQEQGADGEEEDLDFDLDLSQPPSQPSSTSTVVKGTVTGQGGTMDFDLDLDLEEGPDTESDDPPPVGNLIELEDDHPASDAPVDSDAASEAETKLELARAYKDMGDNEGAKELLEEVMRDGSSEQKQRAQALLGEIS